MDPRTINHHLKLLGRMFRVARKWKLIRDVPEIGLLKARKPEFDFLDFDEAEAFVAGVAKQAPEWHPFVVVAMRTGLRVGELAGLRWREDVDLDRGRLRVQQSYNKHNGFMTTKNDKIREIPLTWDAIEALRVQRERVDGELVFPGPDGKPLIAEYSNDALEEICEQLGLGHGSMDVTMRYAHLSDAIGDELIRRLAPPQKPGDSTHDGAAELQHMDGARTRQTPNSGSDTHEEVRS